MRKPRLKILHKTSGYHLFSRLVAGLHIFKEPAVADKFTEILDVVSDFSGIELVSWSLPSNHFHLVVRVPKNVTVTDEEILRRAIRLYGEKDSKVKRWKKYFAANGRLPENVRKQLLKMMYDISMFCKLLKQRLTTWYNKTHDRHGTLWSERFGSQVLEDQSTSMINVAAYVDLNPVRAGLVQDPADYPYSSYARAVRGDPKAIAGLSSMLPGNSWEEKLNAYRRLLFGTALTAGHSSKKVLDPEYVKEQLKKEAPMDMAQLLRLRWNYLVFSPALGSQEFCEEVFQTYRQHFAARRTQAAFPMKGGAWGGMMAMCDLGDRALRR